MRKHILKSHVSTAALTLSIGVVGFAAPAFAACTADASHNVTCAGANTAPLTIYDQAAQFQPAAGSNAYTPANPAYPAASNPNNPGYNPNPPTAFVTIDPGATFATTVTAANRTTALTDGGLISANYSNTEDPAVNNVTVNNFGSITVTNTQSTNRASAIVADSQINVFTLNNAAGATIAVRSALVDPTFNSALLQNTASATAAPTPPTYTARYPTAGTSLAITSALYSDDNTNSFVVNNQGAITATGHYAAGYYGRADTTIVNSGTFGNTDWKPTDHIYDGHWAIATFAGADFATLAGSNPDTPVYDVKNVAIVNGVYTGTIAVTDTNATTVKNSGLISGDILVLDTNPLVTAAAAARGQALPLAVSGSNSGPRDSSITNTGTINGSFYLGSGAHVIENEQSGTIAGSINVDQRASVGTFAAAVPGTTAGSYASVGPATKGANGAACPATGANTSDPLCAQTRTVQASFAGDRTFNLTNKGVLAGDVTIIDQPDSVNKISLTGTGFAGNLVALNGTGSNSLVLNGVTNLTSVQNFSNLNLKTSNVAVTNGVSLVDGATIRTQVYGKGGTFAKPSTKLGTINGTLTLAGATKVVPTIRAFVRNGDTYQLASVVNGPGAADIRVKQSDSVLVKTRADTSSGKLLLEAQVRDPRTIAGITQPGGATLGGLLSYDGSDAAVRALGRTVEGFTNDGAVRQAGNALSPITNGADIQIPINSAMLFHQQIDARLDNFIYAQIPVSGRSADLGPSHPVPVYGLLPPSGAWIEGIGGGVNQGAVSGVNGYNAELEGVIGGYDRLITPAFRVGGAFGFINGNVNGNSNFTGNRETIQTYQGLVYGTIEQPNYYLRGSVGYGGVNFQDVRQISFANFTDTAYGSHSGNIFTARGEGGVPFEYRSSLLVPYAAFTYSHLNQGAYGETSAAGAAFDYRSASNDSERSEVGGKVVVPLVEYPVFSYLFPVGSFVALEARAAYVHEFGNVAQTVAASFVGGGNVFIASGPVPDRDMVDYGVGLRMGSGRWQVDLSYNGLARSTYLQQVGLLKVRYLF